VSLFGVGIAVSRQVKTCASFHMVLNGALNWPLFRSIANWYITA
jgi:hypothetical protein